MTLRLIQLSWGCRMETTKVTWSRSVTCISKLCSESFIDYIPSLVEQNPPELPHAGCVHKCIYIFIGIYAHIWLCLNNYICIDTCIQLLIFYRKHHTNTPNKIFTK